MQRARIHSGGGSMPSLQAIDSTPPPSIDMQVKEREGGEGGMWQKANITLLHI